MDYIIDKVSNLIEQQKDLKKQQQTVNEKYNDVRTKYRSIGNKIVLVLSKARKSKPSKKIGIDGEKYSRQVCISGIGLGLAYSYGNNSVITELSDQFEYFQEYSKQFASGIVSKDLKKKFKLLVKEMKNFSGSVSRSDLGSGLNKNSAIYREIKPTTIYVCDDGEIRLSNSETLSEYDSGNDSLDFDYNKAFTDVTMVSHIKAEPVVEDIRNSYSKGIKYLKNEEKKIQRFDEKVNEIFADEIFLSSI